LYPIQLGNRQSAVVNTTSTRHLCPIGILPYFGRDYKLNLKFCFRLISLIVKHVKFRHRTGHLHRLPVAIDNAGPPPCDFRLSALKSPTSLLHPTLSCIPTPVLSIRRSSISWHPRSKLLSMSRMSSHTLLKRLLSWSLPSRNTALGPNPKLLAKPTPVPAAPIKQYVPLHRKVQILIYQP
jgi:hypothetical protein